MSSALLLYDYPGSLCCQMVRLVLAEKDVAYDRHRVDIIALGQQFEPWYIRLNPRAVVPTLVIGDEVLCDTKHICLEVDHRFSGPALSPSDPAERARMEQWMNDVMAPHYGVLLYSQNLDSQRRSQVIIERGRALRAMRQERPEAAVLLDRRIAGNERLQQILLDPDEVAVHQRGIQDLLVQLEAGLGQQQYAVGDQWTLADAFWTAALARFEVHGLDTWSGGRLPEVSAYYLRLQERPSWSAAGVVNRGSVMH